MSRTHNFDRHLSPNLTLYLRDIQQDELLSAEEERTLAKAIARGDEQARAQLIRANLRLVITIARDYAGRGLSLDDLVGEGNLGLIKATQEFDPDFGTRFSTYAAHWIKQAIRYALTNTAATIRLPAHMVGLLNRWRRAERALIRVLGRKPLREEIADVLHLSASQRQMVDRALQASHLCTEAGLPGGVEEGGFAETADPSDAPEALLEETESRQHLLRRLDRLEDRERLVLVLRFGLEGQNPLTLKEVGRRLGVTREWVRKIEIRAVQKLHDSVQAVGSEPRVECVRRRKPMAVASA